MKRTAIVAVLVLAAVAAAAVVVVTTRPVPQDPHIARAREFLSVNELGAATSELKIALKKRPDSEEAKALLLYAKGRAEEDGAVTMFSIYPVLAVLADAEERDTLDPAMRAEFEDMAKKLRALLYEEGIDTRDIGELVAIVRRAARFALDEASEPADADHAAYALASGGDERAMAHLCERLKSDKAVAVPDLIEKLGPPAVEPLRAIAADRQHLGRARAIHSLSKLLARERARDFFVGEPNLRGLDLADLPEPLRALAGEAVSARHVAGLTRQLVSQSALIDRSADAPGQLGSFYAPLGEDRGLLALQGYDPKGQRVLLRLYLFDGTQYQSAELIEDGKATFTASPLARLRPLGPDRIELAFLTVTGVPEERRVARGSFRQGERVALRKGDSAGTVSGTDEFGLIRVRLDAPLRGMTELELDPVMLVGLQTVTVEKPGYEVREGRVTGRRVELGPRLPVASLSAPPATADEEL